MTTYASHEFRATSRSNRDAASPTFAGEFSELERITDMLSDVEQRIWARRRSTALLDAQARREAALQVAAVRRGPGRPPRKVVARAA